GNQVPFSKSRWENDYYYFRSLGIGLSYKLRKPVYSRGYSHFDVQLGVGTEYQIPYVKKGQSSFARQLPNGYRGGWINYLTTGFVWENRDSEFDPHHGNRAEFDLRYSPDLISKYGLTSVRMELRQYFYLFHWLTIANRLETRHVTGDIPYWELATLGGENNLRGYPLNRFLGNTSVAYTLELRAWVLKFPQFYNLKFGGQLFTDTGRVFTGQDDVHDLFKGYKQTFGFGGAMSIFSPDFILRGEMGFSDEVTRIYIGIGYLF
ncbi:MAG: BamA/TamA family outer membrane protein, partial [Balneolaceae bacterium]